MPGHPYPTEHDFVVFLAPIEASPWNSATISASPAGIGPCYSS